MNALGLHQCIAELFSSRPLDCAISSLKNPNGALHVADLTGFGPHETSIQTLDSHAGLVRDY